MITQKQMIMTTPSHRDANFDEVRQWNDLRNMLIDVGVDVIVMPNTPSTVRESVYAQDAGFVYKNDFIVSRFKNIERRVDERFIAQWFQDHRFDLLYNPTFDEPRPDSFEGSDLLMSHDQKHLWFGFGPRSSYAFKRHLDDLFDDTETIVRPVVITNSRFTHLSTCFNPLDTGDLLWYPKAIDSHSRMMIEAWYKGRMIEVSEEDAMNMACNVISIGDVIITSTISDTLHDTLTLKGYDVIVVNMTEYNGMCRRLVMEVPT